MNWRTHVAIGSNAIWLAAFSSNLDQSILVFLPVAMFASLLPDIDGYGEGAKIHYIAGGVFSNFRGMSGKYFHHRGIMHSLFVAAIFFVIVYAINFFFLNNAFPLLALVFFVSYLSHSIIDGLNSSVGYLYPFNRKKFSLLPRSLLSPVRGFSDEVLFVIGAFGVLLFFLLYALHFVTQPMI